MIHVSSVDIVASKQQHATSVIHVKRVFIQITKHRNLCGSIRSWDTRSLRYK